MYKEAITGKFVCSWQNLLWTTEIWKYSVLHCHSWKLETVGTYFIFPEKKKKKCNLSVILWKLLKLEDFSIKKSIAPEFVTVKVSQDLKLSAQWNRRLSRCMSKIIECLEQNIRNKIDCKRPSNIKHMNRLQNTGI